MKASIERSISSGKPFAVWRMPGEDHPRLILQEEGSVVSFVPGQQELPLNSGYIVLPFYPAADSPGYMIAQDLLLEEDRPEWIPSDSPPSKPGSPSPEPSDDRAGYLEKLRTLIERIRSGEELEKVVLSRVLDIEREGTESIGELFERLLEAYPNAYVHLFHLPGHGIWIGATPETLIDLNAEEGMIEALAGTRPKGGGQEWTEKEEREQGVVAEHIERVLQEEGVPILRRTGPETVAAGRVEHLSTRYFFSSEVAATRISPLLRELHPTPAVCGLPRDRALRTIRKLEAHQRSFYAGAVGPWKLGGERSLFVNLRCLRVLGDRYQLYVGGGINAASVPEDEWEETEWKGGTLRRALREG